MNFSLHPGAQNDVADALDFYRERAGVAVAERFLDEFERVVALLERHPAFGTPTTRGRRSYPLKLFPYSVVYRPMDNEIRILIVRHQHRRPDYAGGRR